MGPLGRRNRPAQGPGRPGVHRDHRERGRDHRGEARADHGRRHPGRHRLAPVDPLALVADPAVHRDQSGRLGGAARREDPEGRRPHREPVAPGVPVLGRDRRGQAPAQVLQRAALAEPGPRNGPSSRSAIQWCQARSTWETSSAEPCRASSSPEKMAYSVSSVPAGSSLTKPSIRPQRRRISEGRRFSAGAPSASPTASPSSAPLARSLPTAVFIASPFARPAVGVPESESEPEP